MCIGCIVCIASDTSDTGDTVSILKSARVMFSSFAFLRRRWTLPREMPRIRAMSRRDLSCAWSLRMSSISPMSSPDSLLLRWLSSLSYP